MTSRWLAILGIGEDGVEGLAPAARTLIGHAELVVGAARHLALATPLIRGEVLTWPSPLADALPAILARRGSPVAVLASGDPFWFGVGSLLARDVPAEERLCLPAPSAFSLACARLGWALQEVATISFCGRPLAALAPLLQPGARILALSADAGTPEAIAAFLRARGFGPTPPPRAGGAGRPARAHPLDDGAGFCRRHGGAEHGGARNNGRPRRARDPARPRPARRCVRA